MSEPAIRVRRRTYPAKGKAIVGLRLTKKLDSEQLCRKARIDPKTLSRLENSEEAYVSTLTRVAEALGVGIKEIADGLPQSDAPPEPVRANLCILTVTLQVPIDRFDELRGPFELLSELKKRFGLSGEFAVNGVNEGSTKVEFVGTAADWSVIEAAFRSGTLAELGVEHVALHPRNNPLPVTLADLAAHEPRWPWQRWRHRRNLRKSIEAISAAAVPATSAPWNRPGYWERYRASMVLAVLALTCVLSGVLPLDARFGYGSGILLAVAAFLLGRWTKRRKLRQRDRLVFMGMSDPGDMRLHGTDELIPGVVSRINRGLRWPARRLPLLALLLNVIAALAWPWCVGFVKTPEGYHFGVVNRGQALANPDAQR